MSSYDDEKSEAGGCLLIVMSAFGCFIVIALGQIKDAIKEQPETQTADATTRERRLTPPVPGNSEAREGDPSPSLALNSVQGAEQPSSSRSERLSGGAAVQLGSPTALVSALDSFDLQPSAGTIAWMTIELWRQPEFLELTQEEAHALLAEDDHLGLSGQESLLALIGPLPTLEDCEAGMRSQVVQAALQEVLILEAPLIKLGEIPDHRRGHWAEQRRLELVRMKTEAELDLMRALEEATGYPNWRLLYRLYEKWSGL